MTDIKVFVCWHEQMEVPEHPLPVPVQVGAALADSHFPGFLYDDVGDNIGGDRCAMILGDNIFYGTGLTGQLR